MTDVTKEEVEDISKLMETCKRLPLLMFGMVGKEVTYLGAKYKIVGVDRAYYGTFEVMCGNEEAVLSIHDFEL